MMLYMIIAFLLCIGLLQGGFLLNVCILLVMTVGVLLHIIIRLAATIESLKEENIKLKSYQRSKDRNSRANIMLLKNRFNVQKSETEDFQILVKKLSNDFAGLLKGLVLSKMANKKLKRDLREVTQLKNKLLEEKSTQYEKIFKLNDEIGHLNEKVEDLMDFWVV